MKETESLRAHTIPAHVGVIMDGNGRWAKKRGLPRNLGHKQGAQTFGEIARHAARRGIAHLTVYAFSTENWRRPPEEVGAIMDLLRSYLKDVQRYKKENMRVRILGDTQPLAPDIREMIVALENNSRENTGMSLNIALNYGSRDEIMHAARRLAQEYAGGQLAELEDVDEALFSRYLYTSGQPDVDLVIRTSGENRISNFLLWQSAYAEYVFTDVLWPDFTPAHFDAALQEYATRTRRMGGL